jgi:recombination associated protein RdgC
MFKNLQIYRLPAPWAMRADALALLLAARAFQPCTSAELQRMGWVPPREGGELVHTVNRQLLLRRRVEKKLLPASVIAQVAKARADELEEQQGFRPGKKAMKELKERAADELLPRAFGVLAHTWVWIDPVNGWLVVDAASPARAEDVVKLLLKAITRMPLESLRVQRSPVAAMTGWLEADEAPAGFTIDQEAEMVSAGASGATVRYVKHTLEAADIRRHIAAGKQCTRVALTWKGKLSFVLTDSLAIKALRALDVLRESEAATYNDAERFDNDFMLMSGELAQLLADLVAALGGEGDDLASAAQKEAA